MFLLTDKKVASFQERFIELIDNSPKSQTTIAQEFGVAKQTISAWYTGQTSPRLPSTSALADYFGVSLGWLLGYDVPKYIDEEKLHSYEAYVSDALTQQKALGLMPPDESGLILSYRSLSPRGQQLLLDRAEELKLLFGKKSEGNPAEPLCRP